MKGDNDIDIFASVKEANINFHNTQSWKCKTFRIKLVAILFIIKKSVALYINSLRNVITSRENKVHEMEIFSKGSWPLHIRFVRWFLFKD